MANKSEVAEFFGVARQTVDDWVRTGCPVVRRGTRTQPWQLDMLDVLRWYYTNRTATITDPEKMTPGERKSWYDSEAKRIELETRAKQLLRASEVELAVATAYIEIRDSSRLIPELAEKRIDLSPEHRAELEQAIDDCLAALANQLGTLAPCLAAFRGDRDT